MIYDSKKLSRNYNEHPLQGKELPTVEDVFYLYITCNYTIKEMLEIFHCNYHPLKGLILREGISKSREAQLRSTKEMWQRKYGVDNPAKLKAVTEKRKQTNLEKYGHVCSLHGDGIKEKVQNTFIERYGDTTAARNEATKQKKRKTNLERYGVEEVLTSDKIKQKIKNTNLKKYGTEYPTQSAQVQEKTKRTNLEKYGVERATQSEEIKRKTKENNLQKYGVEYPRQLKEVDDRIKQTNLERYGSISALGSEEVQQRIKNTNLDKYGVVYPIQLEEVKQRRRQNNIEKWGTSNISTKHLSKETLEIISSKDLFTQYIKDNNLKTVYEVADSLGLSYGGAQLKLHTYGLWDLLDHFTSKPEQELIQLLPTFHKTKSILNPYEIDLYNDELKLGIEFNGDYWHSTIHKDKFYHQHKSMLAKEKGVFLYHIFEYEWNDPRIRSIILSQLTNLQGNNQKIGARKCQIREIDFPTTQLFLNENHLQGEDRSSIRYGLFFNNELVSVMTFCKPRFNKRFDWELSRFCCKRNTTVIGGASKLFKHFLSNHNGSIISYSNMSKTRGTLYSKLGFQFKNYSTPSYVWSNGVQAISRYQCQKHRLKEFSELGDTEFEIMQNRGFVQIFDCGCGVWTFN